MKSNNNQYQYQKHWLMHHFQQYFRYIVVACLIRGGNRITRRKKPDLSQATDKL